MGTPRQRCAAGRQTVCQSKKACRRSQLTHLATCVSAHADGLTSALPDTYPTHHPNFDPNVASQDFIQEFANAKWPVDALAHTFAFQYFHALAGHCSATNLAPAFSP